MSRLIRGIFKKKPQLPRYSCTYNPDKVLNFISDLPSDSSLMLEELTKKLVILLCLLSASRVQTIAKINIDYIHLGDEEVTIYIPSLLKSTKPSFHQQPILLTHYAPNPKLSITSCLTEYLERTKNICENLPGNLKRTLFSHTLTLTCQYPVQQLHVTQNPS